MCREDLIFTRRTGADLVFGKVRDLIARERTVASAFNGQYRDLMKPVFNVHPRAQREA
jgi:hypothetical protein